MNKKYYIFIVILVCLLINFVGACKKNDEENWEKPGEEARSLGWKAVKLAKECIVIEGNGMKYSAQEVIKADGASKRSYGDRWRYTAITESIYSVTYLYSIEGESYFWLFHVLPKDGEVYLITDAKKEGFYSKYLESLDSVYTFNNMLSEVHLGEEYKVIKLVQDYSGLYGDDLTVEEHIEFVNKDNDYQPFAWRARKMDDFQSSAWKARRVDLNTFIVVYFYLIKGATKSALFKVVPEKGLIQIIEDGKAKDEYLSLLKSENDREYRKKINRIKGWSEVMQNQ